MTRSPTWAAWALLLLLIPACSRDTSGRGQPFAWEQNSWTKYVPPFDSLERFHLSPDGNNVCYLIKRGGKWSVGINGRHSQDFTGTYLSGQDAEPRVVLSPDGQHVGVVYQRQAAWRTAQELGQPDGAAPRPQWFVEIDRRVLGGFDGDFVPELQFSTDGKTFGLVYKREGQYYIQIVETILGPYLRADFAITAEGEVVIAYLEGSYIHVEHLARSEMAKTK